MNEGLRVALAPLIRSMEAVRHEDTTTEQSVLRNLNNGCDISSVAESHNMSTDQVHSIWFQHFGEMAGLKFCRWSQISDLAAAALMATLQRRMRDPDEFSRTSMGAWLKVAESASKIAENNAKLAMDIQMLPRHVNVQQFSALQRDVYFETREVLDEREIVDRALMGNDTLQKICDTHGVKWRNQE